ATPSLRLERRGEHLSPFIEGGIGIHYLSDTVDASHAQLSTRFQFGDYVGVGARFGRDGQYAISARFVHYSNGGIHKPNRGADMGMINFAYRF
ncbi:MAG: acyloxyacyl hydrolase, partial [Burkholderiales bacterium]|nr:acyloxyacyl hydrolase [Burkholderiales bacterium]